MGSPLPPSRLRAHAVHAARVGVFVGPLLVGPWFAAESVAAESFAAMPQGEPAARASTELASEASKQARDQALRRDPRTLPRAAAGAWRTWKSTDPAPEAVRDSFVAGARAYYEGDYAAALAGLYDVLERAPDHPGALYQGAIAHFRLRRYGDCAVLAERFVEVVPGEVGATQVLGHAYYTLGDYELARAHYQRVVAAAPDSVEAWRGLGLSHLRLGAAVEALRALDKALELKPDHADALVWRAQALIDVDRAADALASALRGRELAPFEPRTWFVLGAIFAELDREEDAAAARERFLELNRIEQQVRAQEALLLHEPRAVEPRVRLVRLHVAAGNGQEALENLKRLQVLVPGSLDVALLALESAVALREFAAADAVVAEMEKDFSTSLQAWSAIEAYHRTRGNEDGARRAAGRRAALQAAGR